MVNDNYFKTSLLEIMTHSLSMLRQAGFLDQGSVKKIMKVMYDELKQQ